jgi:hypothetical protein
MSYIGFNTKGREMVKVRGSERAHMQIMFVDIAAAILPRGLGQVHPLLKIIPKSQQWRWEPQLQGPGALEWVQIYLSSHSDNKLEFNGERHNATETVLNTILAMDSNVMSFMAKVWGTCETHGWFPVEDHAYFAKIIRKGRELSILRADAGWEAVAEMFEAELSGPVVMTYSVTDGFPNPYVVGLNDEASIERWYEMLDEDEQWDTAIAGLQSQPHRKISKETLHGEWFLDASTLWDAMESPEWKENADG